MSLMKDASIDLHNRYGDMFSDELVKEYARVMYREGGGRGWQDKLESILSAIRSAVIREESVGTVSTYTTLDGPEGNEYMRTDWTIEGNYPEDGTFSLIPASVLAPAKEVAG